MDIELVDLKKSFGGNLVLSGFSARLPVGSSTLLMGPSGSGKTTLLSLILGLQKPDGGEIINLPERMSAVFQEDRLCERISAIKNVAIVMPGKPDSGHIIAELACVGLSMEDVIKPASELSGGMRRRVAIVRALLAESDLVLMDEPFQGLDPGIKNTVAAYIRDRIRGRTLVTVSHDAGDAELLGAEIIRIQR